MIKPIVFKGNTLNPGSELYYRYSGINIIKLNDGETFKIHDVSCKRYVNFENESFCKCYIAKSFSINGFVLEPPAEVMFDGSKFVMFYSAGFASKGVGYGSGFYEVTNDGKPNKLPSDVQGLNCGAG